jgi:hypothetical protein
MESGLLGAADICDKLPVWDYYTLETILYKHILHLDTAAYSMVNLKQKKNKQIWGKDTNCKCQKILGKNFETKRRQ